MIRLDCKAWWLLISPGVLTLLAGLLVGVLAAAVFMVGFLLYQKIGGG